MLAHATIMLPVRDCRFHRDNLGLQALLDMTDEQVGGVWEFDTESRPMHDGSYGGVWESSQNFHQHQCLCSPDWQSGAG
jgi:hypothetical protein